MSIQWDDVRSRIMGNPEVKKAYEELTREQPKPGEKWRECTGDEYAVIAIAYYRVPNNKYVIYSSSPEDKIWLPDSPIYSTESNQVFYIPTVAPHNEDGLIELQLSGVVRTNKTKVVESVIWARPLSSFMDVVSRPYGAKSSNCFRFERITSPQPSASVPATQPD